jgi:hypothetical protein
MIWPTFILVGFGRFIWIPLPVILLWPLLILLWMVSLGALFFPRDSNARGWFVALRGIFVVFAAIRGTRATIVPQDGPRIRILIV